MKYTKAMYLVIFFYILIIIVGGGQAIWSVLTSKSSIPLTFDQFYMFWRFILSTFVLILFLMKLRALLVLTIIMESSVNIFYSSYATFESIWHISRLQTLEQIQQEMWFLGPNIGWNALLCLISIIIVSYMAYAWRKIIPNQQVDPIVTTPVDKVEAQSTQGHP